MAKLKGPLFSIDARGKLGNSLVFSSNRGIKRASKHYSPTNPRTLIQQDNRSIFSYAILSWQSLTDDQKESYNQSARNLSLKMSGYNYYLQTYLAEYGEAPPVPAYITDGLIAYWNMDENAGDVVADSIGANNGTRQNALWVPGKHNSGLDFNSGAGDIALATPGLPVGNSDRTFMCWYYRPSAPTYSIFFAYGKSATSKTMYFDLRTAGGIYFLGYGNDWLFNDYLFSTGFWYFIVFTYTGATKELKEYVDGDWKETKVLSLALNTELDWGYFGNGLYNRRCVGTIDEAAMYNRALSPAEVQQNYEVFL